MIRIFLLAALAIVADCRLRKTGYIVILTVETTSDWTDVIFQKQEPICLGLNIITPTNKNFKIRTFAIEKRPYDSTLVRVEYPLFIPNGSDYEDTIVIKKGNIGYTKIQLSSPKANSGLSLLNDKNILGDPGNLMKYTISHDDFARIGIHSELPKLQPPSVEPLVLAFYYPWYKIWHRSGKQITLNTPKIGFYYSADTSVIKSHIRFAKEAGIDCFIISWFGIGSFTDSVAQIMIPFLERNQIKFTVYLEQCDSLFQFIKIKKYLNKHFFNSSYYLAVGGKPTLLIYSRVPEKIRNEQIPIVADDLFIVNFGSTYKEIMRTDGIHVYFPTFPITKLDSINQISSLLAHYHNKVFMATVYPGFDNRPSRFPGIQGKFVDREGENFYHKTWTAALASDPDWIAIISFNEWGEATEIEPSIEYGDRYLKITKKYVDKFKGLK